MKTALITGITGQDGSYLAELLLGQDYEVHGIVRRASSFHTGRIEHLRLHPKMNLHFGDVTDGTGLRRVLELAEPDEVYNLAAQSHVAVSFEQPEYTADVVATGTLRLLDAVRDMKAPIRFYQASSSEMFGSAPAPQDEQTAFHPRSPYGVSKTAAHWHAVNYREAYGMHISCGMLFNHTSPRRGETFVCRKITRAATRIAMGLQDKLHLGRLDTMRDWGWAPEFVEAMWLMLQQPAPDDYVIATGQSHSVTDFLSDAFRHLHLSWQSFVVMDERYMRPSEVEELRGDASKAKRGLGWAPRTRFKEIVDKMVDADLVLARQEKLVKESR
jgi:GDPmannose 4,6-dehydratase